MTEFAQSYKKIHSKLITTRFLENFVILSTSLLMNSSIALVSLLFLSSVEMFAKGDEIFRTSMAVVFLFATFIGFVYYLVPSLLRFVGIMNNPTTEQIALRVGNYYEEIRDNLLNSMQLFKSVEQNQSPSPELSFAAFNEISQNVKDKNFNVIIDYSKLRAAFLYFIIPFLTFYGLNNYYPDFQDAFHRLKNYNQSFLPPAPFELYIENQQIEALRGEDVTIIIKAKGKAPDFINLKIKEEKQDAFETYRLRLDTNKEYQYKIPSIKNNIVYYGASAWYSSEVQTQIAKISVYEKPLIKSFTGRLVYPTYTNFSSKDFNEQSADLTALIGSRVDIAISSSKALDSAYIIIESMFDSETQDSTKSDSDKQKISCKVTDKTAIGNFRITKNCMYSILVKDKDGQYNENPIKYNINALEDGFPSITMITPTQDTKISENALLPMKLNISDDYGFRDLVLNYKLIKSDFASPYNEYKQVKISLSNNDLIQEVAYIWDLNKLNITPSDEYEYYVEIFDNDIVSGPKSSRTQIMKVKMPSFEEVLNETNQAQKDVQKNLEKVLKESEELKKEIDDLNKELRKDFKKKEMDWDDKKKAEDISKKQEQLKQKLDDVKKDLENATKQMQENKVLSPETLQKYFELQKLMSQINVPELKKMQEAMQKAMEQMTPEEMQKATQQMQFDEEQFRKAIERSMKIMQRMQAEQKADALSKMADEMKDKLGEMSQQSENANPKDEKKKQDLQKQQEAMQKSMDNLQKQADELDEMMKEMGEQKAQKQLEDAMNELEKSEAEKNMDEAQQDMEKGDFKKASQKQKQAQQSMQKFAQQMKKMKQDLNDNVSKEAQRKMQRSIQDMINLSKEQEKLKNQTQNASANSNKLPEINNQQNKLSEKMNSIANSMSELAEKSFAVTPEMGKEMGEAMQKMEQAKAELAERQSGKAQLSQQQAMAGMNKTAQMMQDALQQMQGQGQGQGEGGPGGQSQGQSGSSMSFQQRLQQAAAQQQMINQSMQQMMQQQGNQPGSQGTSGQNGSQSGQGERKKDGEFGNMVDKQGKAKKSLEELAEEQKKFGNDGDRKTLGDLNKIVKDMEEVMSDMKSGSVTDETIRKQDKILSRMLDATKSMNDRDYEKEREAKSGKDYNRASPTLDLKTDDGKNKALQELMKSLRLGYTKDYENLIRRYFDAIKEKQ